MLSEYFPKFNICKWKQENFDNMQIVYKYIGMNKDCSSNFRSKHSTNTVLCLLQNLLEQSLFSCYSSKLTCINKVGIYHF